MNRRADIARKLQYTNVEPNATQSDIRQHCETAAKYEFHAVMIQPCWVPMARDILRGTPVRVATAIAYPMGGESAAMKVALVKEVLRLGADEFDFQPNIGFLRSGMEIEFEDEIRKIVEAADGLPSKSMSEFGFLTEKEKIRCVRLAECAGVTYVKNSSGVGTGGTRATPEVIHFIRRHLSGTARIKASGQIRSFEQATALIAAGADLIGTSAAPAIADEKSTESGGY